LVVKESQATIELKRIRVIASLPEGTSWASREHFLGFFSVGKVID
jgi:hypothetical protein